MLSAISRSGRAGSLKDKNRLDFSLSPYRHFEERSVRKVDPDSEDIGQTQLDADFLKQRPNLRAIKVTHQVNIGVCCRLAAGAGAEEQQTHKPRFAKLAFMPPQLFDDLFPIHISGYTSFASVHRTIAANLYQTDRPSNLLLPTAAERTVNLHERQPLIQLRPR